MKNQFLVAILLTLCFTSINAQTFTGRLEYSSPSQNYNGSAANFPDGNAGAYHVTGGNDPWTSSSYQILMHTDSIGMIDWSYRVDTILGWDISTFDIKQTSNADIVFSSIHHTSLQSGMSVFSCGANGSYNWHKYYQSIDTLKTESNPYNRSWIVKTPDQGFVVSELVSNPPNDEMYIHLIKMDAAGNPLWSNIYGDPDQAFQKTNEYKMDICSNGDIVLFARFSEDLNSAITIIRIAPNGNMLWHKKYIHTNVFFGVNDGIVTSDGGYAITGHGYNSNFTFRCIYLLKTDSVGNIEFCRTYVDNLKGTAGRNVRENSNGDFVISAYPVTGGTSDGYLFSTDSAGQIIWSDYIINFYPYDLQLKNGGYLVSGATTYFDTLITLYSNFNGYIGCSESPRQLIEDTLQLQIVYDLIQAPLLIATQIIPNEHTNATVNASSPCFIKSNTANLETENLIVEINPNPAQDFINIQSNCNFERVEIYDIAGKTIYAQTIKAKSVAISTLGISSGVYFARVYSKDGMITKRFVLNP
jgi:Secretion system C-terminal sorting domain